MEWIGWVATAAFASSYFFRRPGALRIVQALAATLWIAYGALIHAWPAIVAKAVMAAVAVWSAILRDERSDAGQGGSAISAGLGRS